MYDAFDEMETDQVMEINRKIVNLPLKNMQCGNTPHFFSAKWGLFNNNLRNNASRHSWSQHG